MFVTASILHADLDSFYASVEQRDDPQLRNRPMIVGRGIVLAASYEAKAFGIRTAMGTKAALRLCPHALVVPARMAAYSEASRAVFEIFRDTSPLVEPVSIDEAFIDVGGLARIVGPAPQIAATLRQRVSTGVGLPITVGVASTKHCAKVASQAGKPDGLLVIPEGGELDFLWPLPVNKLWGVGKKTTTKLGLMGIATIGELATADPERLRTTLGNAHTGHLQALANNRDPRHVDTDRRRKSIGSQRSFPAGGLTGEDAWVITIELVDSISGTMRAKEIMGRTLTMNLRDNNFTTFSRSTTMAEATWSSAALGRAAKKLFQENWPFINSGGCTKLGLSVSNLTAPNNVQQAFNFDPGRAPEVDAAIDAIKEKFGHAAIGRTAKTSRAGTHWH
ncbi:MAG: DNA polymerase IV [Acidimicrobiales bacterium]|nr:DNA polymerase IV [Acidimicrobiales bacterium]